MRLQELLDDMISAPDGQINIKEFRDRIVALHEESGSEDERTILIQCYCNLMDLAERQATTHQIDVERLREVRSSEMRFFCIKEAMLDGENIDPDELLRVASREVDAGRMPADDFLEHARAGADVFGTARQSEESKGRGFLSRLLGRT